MDYKFLATQEFQSDDFQIEIRKKLARLKKLEKEKIKLESWIRRFYVDDVEDKDSGNEEDCNFDQQLRYEERLDNVLEETEQIKEDIEDMINNMDWKGIWIKEIKIIINLEFFYV